MEVCSSWSRTILSRRDILWRSPFSLRRPFLLRLTSRVQYLKPLPVRSTPLVLAASAFENEKQLESTKIPSELRQKVEDAVEQQGNRVTVGDVSSKAGVTLAQAEDTLKALAADSLGTLEVSSEGEVVYVFASNFKNQIRSKSFMLRMEPRLKAASAIVARLGRILFGVTFVATVIAVWVAIFVIATSSDRDDNRSSRSSMRRSGAMFDLLDVFRLMYYMNGTRRYEPDREQRDQNQMNFMEAVFSYMFGDGDPNQEFDDSRWNTIGNFIRSRGGVVVAEEIAPFLDLPKGWDDESSVVDEGYVLPVLTRFEGEPMVNNLGQLVYVFPKLQTTGLERWQMGRSTPASYMKEQLWKFSNAGSGQLAMVLFFAVANVVGVGILQNLAFESMATGALVAPGLPIVLAALNVYAWSFFLIPLIRFFVNRSRNNTIKDRNDRRAQSASKVEIPTPALRSKLQSARKLSKRKFIDRKDVMYSSEKDMAEQAKKWEEEDFDRRLREVGQ